MFDVEPPRTTTLPAEVRNFAVKLSVFTGGFFLDAAIGVTLNDDAARLLEIMRDCSWLHTKEMLGQVRYILYPAARDYLATLAKEISEVDVLRRRERHSVYFCELLEKESAAIDGPEGEMAVERITANLENIRAGMDDAYERKDRPLFIRYADAFGSYLRKRNLGAENVRRCQVALQCAKKLRNARAMALCGMNLGYAYLCLRDANRESNLQNAISCYLRALILFHEGDSPQIWAKAQGNLGLAYAALPKSGDNLQEAIMRYKAALRVYTEQTTPHEWAAMQVALGSANQGLTEYALYDRNERLINAFTCYLAALRVYTEQAEPKNWAMTLKLLARAYKIYGDYARAESCYHDACRGFLIVGMQEEAAAMRRWASELKSEWIVQQAGRGG